MDHCLRRHCPLLYLFFNHVVEEQLVTAHVLVLVAVLEVLGLKLFHNFFLSFAFSTAAGQAVFDAGPGTVGMLGGEKPLFFQRYLWVLNFAMLAAWKLR